MGQQWWEGHKIFWTMFLVITGYFALHTLVRVLLAHGRHVPHLQVASRQYREVLCWLPPVTPDSGLGS